MRDDEYTFRFSSSIAVDEDTIIVRYTTDASTYYNYYGIVYPNTTGTTSTSARDWDCRPKNRYETKTLKLLGKLSDIEIYYGINPEHDYIFVDGWNNELEDIYTKHNLYKLPNTNNHDDNQWVITGSTDDFKVFIDSLQNSPNYNAISTIDDILNDFVMKELEE